MAVDMFLTLDGVKGESEDKNHPKQIGVLSWSWGTSCGGSAHVGGGPPASAKSMAGPAKSPNSWWHRRLKSPEGRCGGKTLIRLLALLLALAVTAPVLLAEDGGQELGNANDLTGVWTQTYVDLGSLVLATFNEGGTASADQQGDIVFAPVQSHEHGLWRKTGPRTFIASFAVMEYNREPVGSLFGTAILQARYTLYPSGDQYDGLVLITETLTNGTVNTIGPLRPHGVRLRLTPPAF